MLVVLAHDGDDDAVRIANDSPYGLSATVFGPAERAARVAARLRTGTVNVNGGVWYSATRRSVATSSPVSAARWAWPGSRNIWRPN